MPDKEPTMDRLTGQLYHLPYIIGQMGLSIANAQKAFNVDYLENVIKIMTLIKETVGSAGNTPEERLAAVKSLLEALAPSRYQFTEATLDFRADLAETMDKAGQLGLGFGTSAITVNAAFALSYGYDYRAAARITAKLHAIPANPEMTKTLLDRAGEIDKEKLDMPQLSQVEQSIFDGVEKVYQSLIEASGQTPSNP